MEFGTLMPDIFIGRVILNPSIVKVKARRSLNKGTEATNLSAPMDVNIELIVKQYKKPTLKQEKYLKFAILQCTSQATFYRIKDDPKSFMRRIDVA